MAEHVAIKCTYNNGGEGVYVGFSRICSENIIKWNIEHGRVWCGSKNCPCRKYYDKSFKGKPPTSSCYEGDLFRHWRFGAGWYHTGKKEGPIHISNVDKGKIAILTTRFPGDKEIDRKIIGFFLIGQIIEDPDTETIMIADKEFRLRLPLDEAKELYFWDYYSTKGGARWNTLLHRYLHDKQLVNILSDLRNTLKDEKMRRIVDKLLIKDFAHIPAAKASGPRIRKSGDRTVRVALIRKYGSGGESKEHKQLKEWVAEHPNTIGLPNVIDTAIEYVFPSGDVADIIFKLRGDKYAVVEIKTFYPLSGCYQALKYRTLKCAELGIDIDSSNVEAILVASTLPKEVWHFCSRYGIRPIKKIL